MEKFGKGQSITRIEDQRFLTGSGRYVDDIVPAKSLFVSFLRSPVAHGKITSIDLTQARQMNGIHLVATAKDLEAAGVKLKIDAALIKNRDGSSAASPERNILAKDYVRFVGEPIAMVVSDTIELGRDALEAIALEIDELPANLAFSPNNITIYPDIRQNRAFDWGLGDEFATEQAFANAHQVVSLQVANNRVIVNSMEPRTCYAEMDGKKLHFCFSSQGVWGFKNRLIHAFGLDADHVRVTTPDVGGGFGMKVMVYPEYYSVAYAALVLRRPARWASERSEAMLTDNGGRCLTSFAEMAFDDSHKITAYRVRTQCNLGAYNSQYGQPIQTELFSRVLTGPYDIQTFWMQVEGYYTNTVQIDAYRGAGRPEAIYVLERVMDRAARELEVDPWELRKRNFIARDRFPYKSATGETYDIGDFDRVLTRAATEFDLAGYVERKAASSANGRLRGYGLCYYIECILGEPTENARLVFEEDGTLSVFVGTQSNGQGHETVYTQFISDQTGISPSAIRIIQGDSDRITYGGGTGGSRSVTLQSNAFLLTIEQIVARFREFFAQKMDVHVDEVTFDDETFRTKTSNVSASVMQVAEWVRSEGRDDLLSYEARYQIDGRSFPNGAHIAEVEIDPETGSTSVDRYIVVDDFGNIMNPLLVQGQVHGGVAQAIGQALTENTVYDSDGQLLSATFMDYAMPRADHMPPIKFFSEPVPSTANAMGVKGCGEAGTVGALAAVANAVQDALWDKGIRQADMPFTPSKVWEMLESARSAP
ncbi:MAG: xanthine dehydrogenase family protein molybdopterin-binding subunit [Aestuariivita sp.]|nr:xanthine dehydrogenase family protein molybdopterin-binding subunit [Aestuariivita sp.]MCY4201865.1 xanthine dehydrogenase family protein molybdopterin-binding subunit [Aestuariivita sp.]